MTWMWNWSARAMFPSVLFAGGLLGAGAALMFLFAPILFRPSPIVVEQLREADGVIVRGGQIDLVGVRRGSAVCPGATQRYLWRNADIAGQEGVQIVPLQMTVLPAFLPNGAVMISLPVPSTVSDGQWFYRAVTVETCAWLPSWLGGSSVRRTLDVPVEVKG